MVWLSSTLSDSSILFPSKFSVIRLYRDICMPIPDIEMHKYAIVKTIFQINLGFVWFSFNPNRHALATLMLIFTDPCYFQAPPY